MCIGKFLNGRILQDLRKNQVVLVGKMLMQVFFVETFAQIKNTRGYLKFNIGFHCLLHVLEAAKMFVALHIYCAEH